jgi:diguanylate cyclase (GGDEF)-like protein
VLRVVAQRLSVGLRPNDLLVRYGGDEFVVVAYGLHRRRDLERLARRITHSVRQPISVDGRMLQLSASVGIARRNAQFSTADALINEADRAMYQVKQLNRAAARRRAPAANSLTLHATA